MKKFLVIALVFATAALAQSVHYFPYDDTDAVSYQLTSPKKKRVETGVRLWGLGRPTSRIIRQYKPVRAARQSQS